MARSGDGLRSGRGVLLVILVLFAVLGPFVTTLRAADYASPADIPVGIFGKPPLWSEPQLSPDGRRLAALQSPNGYGVLAIMNLEQGRLGAPAFQGGPEVDIYAFRWLSDTRLLLWLTSTFSVDGVTVPFTRLAAVNHDGSDFRVLLAGLQRFETDPFVADLLYATPNAPEKLLMAWQPVNDNRFGVYRIDTNTGDWRLVEQGNRKTVGWLADQEGTARLRVDADGPSATHYWLNDQTRRWEPVTLTTESPRTIIPLAFAKGAPNILYVAVELGQAPTAIYEYDLRAGKLGRKIYGHPTVDVSGLVIDAFDEQLVGVTFVTDEFRVHYIDPEWRAVQSQLDALFPDTNNIMLSRTRSGTGYLFMRDGPRFPAVYYYFDAATRTTLELFESFPDLPETLLADVTPWTYSARDGLPIPAYVTLPQGQTFGPTGNSVPVIVMPHGGPRARDTRGFHFIAQFLASRGYAVLQPNFRGSVGYGARFIEAGRGQWGRAMQDDISDGVQSLVAMGFADPNRIAIVGLSYGGYAALAGAVRTPALYRAVVSVAGVSDLPLFVEALTRFPNARQVRRYLLLSDDDAVLAGESPAREAARVAVPVLLVHGKKDKNVLYEQSERMAKALEAAGKPFEFMSLDEADHQLSRDSDRVAVLMRIEAFLRTHMEPASRTQAP